MSIHCTLTQTGQHELGIIGVRIIGQYDVHAGRIAQQIAPVKQV
jgi:hypothetical protein